MNEFTRKAMSLAEAYANQVAAFIAGKIHSMDAARAALLDYLEGNEQEPEWVRVADRPPEPMTMVLAAFEMDRPGDWRIKCASYEPLCTEFSIITQKGWRIFGGGWTPTHWCPLPATPTEKASK